MRDQVQSPRNRSDKNGFQYALVDDRAHDMARLGAAIVSNSAVGQMFVIRF